MIIRRFVSPVLAANCYILFDPESKSAVVVDPGALTSEPVGQWLAEHDGSVAAVLLTHAHPDHMWDAAAVAGEQPVIVPSPDRYRFSTPNFGLPPEFAFEALAGYPLSAPTNLVELAPEVCQGEGAPIAPGIVIRGIPAPGHTEGSTVFLAQATADAELASFGNVGEQSDSGVRLVMLGGDVIFAGSMGRTDLPGGDDEEMKSSLRTLATVIYPETMILPGHGPATTMAHEKATNPFLQFGAR